MCELVVTSGDALSDQTSIGMAAETAGGTVLKRPSWYYDTGGQDPAGNDAGQVGVARPAVR